METREISISLGQYLKDVLPEIPTNIILDKTICGCGATTLELTSKRHSIIIEPNLPVIMGKVEKHDFMLGVTERVKGKDIVRYFKENNGRYYKIMTTPESYPKVVKAIRSVEMNLHEDFFMLFDECERTTQDVDYRKSIILPIDDFFLCKGKAMVSATPSNFWDPRFEEQNFVKVKICPDYDYRQKLDVRVTNNVYNELSAVLAREEYKDKKFCIFLNSTDKTMNLVEELDIERETNIYCSDKSVRKLRKADYDNSFCNLHEPGQKVALNKYNFFTSRFFSAVDIELPNKPVVIMLTEQFKAKYSMIDPFTEAVQIVGRFRNGVTDFIHITNYNTKRKRKDHRKLHAFLEECHEAYIKYLFEQYHKARSDGERFILYQAKERIDYAEFVFSNGKKNLFRWANFFRDILVAEMYIKPIYIKHIYEKCEAFEATFNFTEYAANDNDRIVLNPNNVIRKKALYKVVLNQIVKLVESEQEGDKLYLGELKKTYKILFNGIQELGYPHLVKMSNEGRLVKKELEKEIKLNRRIKQLNQEQVQDAVYNTFDENAYYTNAQINEKLQEIYENNGIPYNRSGCAPDIEHYFKAEPYRKNSERGWKLESKK